MKKITLFAIFFLVATLPLIGICTILHVPANYSTIQEAIDASTEGDVVLVEPGIYYENLNLNGKNIILCSRYFDTGNTSFIAGTIIDGSNADRVITIDQGENSSCQIIGFTIQHGYSPSYDPNYGGGGIFILDTSPQILHCIIRDNYAPAYGGGICIYGSNSSALVLNCTIENNTAENSGGGVFMGDCTLDAALINCIITGNAITCMCSFSGGGGGVCIYHTGKLENCLITGNSASNASVGGGGVFCDWGDDVNHSILVTGCTIADNTALNSGGVGYVINGGEFRNCIIWGNTDYFGNSANYDGNTFTYCCTVPLPPGDGNLDSDPDFISTGAGNFRLSDGSPCIDAGDNGFTSQSFDLDGNQRIHGGMIDMGAYENNNGLNVQIGSGSDYTEHFPIFSCENYSYSQQIYLGSEITSGGGTSGLISKVRFYYVGGGSQVSNWSDWTVYLGNTARTDFAGTSDWIPANEMTQVFSGTIPEPIPGTWVEISLPAPFYYSGDNIVVAVDENSNGWDCTAYWGSFDSGAWRGLLFHNDNINPDPASPPDASDLPEYYIAQVQFEINPAVGILEGYVTEEPGCVVPIEGATIITGPYSATSDALGYYRLYLPAGVHSNVTAIYNDASQTIASIFIDEGVTFTQDFCLQPWYAPPVGLRAEVTGANLDNAHLTWMPPGSVPDQWIHWDNGTLAGALGYNGPGVFSVASRWPVADIARYGGTYLKKIRFVVSEATASYTLKVWKGANASTLLLSQVITNPFIYAWDEVTLDTPVLIDGTEELWFGYEVVQTTGYPAGLGSGPAAAGKGDMFNGGAGWFSMKEAWGWEFNWPLQGFVSENAMAGPQQVIPMVQNPTPTRVPDNSRTASLNPQVIQLDQPIVGQPLLNLPVMPLALTEPMATKNHASTSSLTGYNVYRDDVKIADNITDLFFDDPALSRGTYNYQVSAQYDNGESARIGPVHVDIYTCFPPTGLSVSNSTLTTTTADLSWTPSTMSTNPEWSLEWGLAGFSEGWGTSVFITGTPAYTLTNLLPGTEYDFYVSTYCSSTDASVRVKKTFRTHYFDCPEGATPEAEICGQSANNGCDLQPTASGTITSGETVCGTGSLSRSHRDPDYYSFTLTGTNDVTLTGNAEFTNYVGIRSDSCQSAFFYSSGYYGAGNNYTLIQRLNAGTYYVFVAPSYAEQVACDSLDRYWVHMTCNTCLSPTALNATNITSNSADLVWTSSAAVWNIEWGSYGFVRGTGTMINGATANPYHLTGLTMGRSYSYYVQSDCGGGATSHWAGPFTFYLPCPATTLPYSEDLNSQNTDTNPQCWQVRGAGAPTNWLVEEANLAGGDILELLFNGWNPWYSGRSYLTSPVINTAGQSQVDLSFKHYLSSYSSGTSCEVWTTSDGGVTWNSVWAVSQAGITGPETLNFAITTTDVGSSTFQFAFAVNGNSWDIGEWHIDDISLTGTVLQTGTLQGVITSCQGANLLAGVNVTAGPNVTATNASGFFQLPDIPSGTYSVELSKPGYVTKSITGVQVLDGGVTTLDDCLELTPVPVNYYLTGEATSYMCKNAVAFIYVAGLPELFTVQVGGDVDLRAGTGIFLYTGTHVKNGGKLHAHITPGGPWCPPPAKMAEDASVPEQTMPLPENTSFTLYPNPTNGNFILVQEGDRSSGTIKVEVYSMSGEKVMTGRMAGEKRHEFGFAGVPAGIYFVKVVADDYVETIKLIRMR